MDVVQQSHTLTATTKEIQHNNKVNWAQLRIDSSLSLSIYIYSLGKGGGM